MSTNDSDAEGKTEATPVEPATAPPGWVHVPSTVNNEVRRLIRRFGADAVKRAVKEEAKAKRGPKKKPDWKELREFIEADARAWLEGRDPFKSLTNHALAKAFAERHPGHSAISTFDRIKRKLRAGTYNRRWYVLVTALELSRDAYPHAAHVRTLDALSKLPGGQEVWRTMLGRVHAKVADYLRYKGQAPAPTLTMAEIEEAVRDAQNPLKALSGVGKPLSLFEAVPPSRKGTGSAA